LNEYERAFIEHMAKSGIAGTDFARLVKDVYQAEFGGQGDALLAGLGPQTLEDPRRFASEVYKEYGMGALQYYSMIVRYVDSGKFNPAEEAEEEAEDADLESIVEEVESSSEQETNGDPAT
jgi:hypothetical protein